VNAKILTGFLRLRYMTRLTTLICFLLIALLAACDDATIPPTLPNIRLDAALLTASPSPEARATVVDPLDATYAPMLLPDGLRDELPVMSGICFEAAFDAAGQVFVLHDALEHIRFYDLADHAQLCRNPVLRYPFDFATGRILAGTWSKGMGCTARHEVLDVQRDDAEKVITLRLKFITEGNCIYELVRPFWVSLPDAADYDVKIDVE
jgi:hypothetical protein